MYKRQALHDPVFTEGVTGPHFLVIAVIAFVALTALTAWSARRAATVSYTHLDVYKRQTMTSASLVSVGYLVLLGALGMYGARRRLGVLLLR